MKLFFGFYQCPATVYVINKLFFWRFYKLITRALLVKHFDGVKRCLSNFIQNNSFWNFISISSRTYNDHLRIMMPFSWHESFFKVRRLMKISTGMCRRAESWNFTLIDSRWNQSKGVRFHLRRKNAFVFRKFCFFKSWFLKFIKNIVTWKIDQII